MGTEHKGDEIGTDILGKVFKHALVVLIRADLKEAAETGVFAMHCAIYVGPI